jgi:redox-sensitive bicupin YhaK (pirin superfamily)
MIKHYPFNQLGKGHHGWLKSSHHFSFANYYNPSRMGFGTLRVVNDDWVQPGKGFPAHPHNNMEIVSIIKTGAIVHQDNLGNKGLTEAGEVQVMSAGTGITHSEYNLTTQPLTFYQIWIETNKRNVKPRWESKKFASTASSEFDLLVSGYAEDKGSALLINQETRIYGGKLSKGTVIEHNIDHQAYILASDGVFKVEDEEQAVTLNKGDAAEVTQSKTVYFKALTDCEIFVIDTAS